MATWQVLFPDVSAWFDHQQLRMVELGGLNATDARQRRNLAFTNAMLAKR
jgi:hypothetical protein